MSDEFLVLGVVMLLISLGEWVVTGVGWNKGFGERQFASTLCQLTTAFPSAQKRPESALFPEFPEFAWGADAGWLHRPSAEPGGRA
jgi:hypothetical protein